jgi:hypothetical protein
LNRPAKRFLVNVKVVTGKECDQSIGIALQNTQKRQGHGDTRAEVQGLLDDAGAASVNQVSSVIRRVSARQNEYLSIAHEERAYAVACLPKKALFAHDRTELLGSAVSCNSLRQIF